MKILTQKDFVDSCVAKYRWETIPEGMNFEDAHYPTPKCKQGTETIPLWSCDHTLQGLFQSEELNHPCLDGRSRSKDIRNLEKYYPEYLPLFYKWDKIRLSRAGTASCIVKHAEKNKEGKSIAAVEGGIASMSEKDENGKSIHAREMSKKAYENDPQSRVRGGLRGGAVSGPINGPALYQNSKGIWDPQYDDVREEWASEGGKIGGSLTVEKKVGLHDPKNKKVCRQNSIKSGHKTSAQVWVCLVTGHTGPPGPLSLHQKRNGINHKDKSLRRRLS
jgi:hypothetical protein